MKARSVEHLSEGELAYLAGMLHASLVVLMQQRRPDLAARLGRVRALMLRAARPSWYAEPERRTEPTGREIDEAADLLLGLLETPGLFSDDAARPLVERAARVLRVWARARQPRLQARRVSKDGADPQLEDDAP